MILVWPFGQVFIRLSHAKCGMTSSSLTILTFSRCLYTASEISVLNKPRQLIQQCKRLYGFHNNLACLRHPLVKTAHL